jgi:eukaryotic-like serine/threonine-protein kinase
LHTFVVADLDILPRLEAALKDRYEFVRELGRGGMAVVYLATDTKHEREVAVKVLFPELAASVGADRFEREIRLAAKLQHPHILGLYDSGQADGLLFYVMPFVKGESLRDRLDREGQLPIEDAIQITLEVAGALGHAHESGIVHRDVKPENVLISNGHALVADFGIARAVSEGGAQKLTQTGMALGTPVYMAPEQAAGEVVGPTADIYSLGCMLYEMLAGEPPFTGKSAMAIMARHAMETVPSIRIVRGSVPEEVEEAIFAAMEKTPTDRPQTAGDFSAILGLPLGATASRRVVMRHTATRRVPIANTTTFETGVAPRPAWRKPWVQTLLALVVLGGGFGVWKLATKGAPPVAAAGGLDLHSVAVLYFKDGSKAQDLGSVADGLTEDLISRLTEVQGLSVVSKRGVEPFRGTTAYDSVAKALDAGTLVEGEVRRSGDDIVVNVSLRDGNSGAEFGNRATIEQPAAALLSVRDSVAEKVADLIRQQLREEIKLQREKVSTNSVEAWSHVQLGETYRRRAEAAAAKGDTTARDQNFAAADSVLALAEQEDAQWAQPSILRGLVAYRRTRVARLDPIRLGRWIEVGLKHMDHAFAIDSNNADAREVKGNLEYWKYLLQLEPDQKKATDLLMQAKYDLEKATRLNTLQAGAWASLSHLYYRTGQLTDVNMAATRAYEADAFLENAATILSRLFSSDFDLRNFTKASDWCDKIHARFPQASEGFGCQLQLDASPAREPPDVPLAWRLVDSVTQYSPAARQQKMRLQSDMLVGIVLARAGLKDSARRVIERSKADAEIDPARDVALIAAWAYCQLDDLPNAVEMFKLFFAAQPQARINYSQDPGWQFKGLKDYPPFQALVSQ